MNKLYGSKMALIISLGLLISGCDDREEITYRIPVPEYVSNANTALQKRYISQFDDKYKCRPAEVDGLWLVACSRGYGIESMRGKDGPLFALFEIKEQNAGAWYCIDPMNGYALIHTTVQEDIFRGMFVCNGTGRDDDLAEYYDEIERAWFTPAVK
ncbi:hypothetical protein [Serratia fonticola]|uniref:Uncharacterized protein n=1 Tax=Serratia fonticola TaxID=47917 RepID=A0ABY9PUR0_SERFO|nr:hypothetical protein [Serratia fonticola]WMT17214.1 hypothetical protein RFB13_13215 [Serratia fonticola]